MELDIHSAINSVIIGNYCNSDDFDLKDSDVRIIAQKSSNSK